MNIIDTIKRFNPTLKKAEIAGILYLIKSEKYLDNNKLVRLTGLPKEELRKFKSTISNMLVQDDSELVELSEEGKDNLTDVELKPYDWSLFRYENDAIENKLKAIRTKYNLMPKREYDQWFATEKSSVGKVMAMNARDCISGKNILLLGDDDLVSSTLGLFGIDYTKITVLDIDQGILDTVVKIAEVNGFKNIETDIYDARNMVPSKYLGQYDVVVTDPPYTRNGIASFLNRAIEFLRGSDKYIFLYYGNSFKSPEKTVKIQEVINKMGLVVEDKIDKFVRYYGAESIGSTSSLYILRTTPFTAPLSKPSINEEIYTFENQAEEKFPFVDHVVVKINKVPSVLMKKNSLKTLLGKFCSKHRLKVIDTKITSFKGGGMTLTYVLANSNLVVHTWDEYNALHLDLITCAPIFKKDEILDSIKELFKTNHVELKFIE